MPQSASCYPMDVVRAREIVLLNPQGLSGKTLRPSRKQLLNALRTLTRSECADELTNKTLWLLQPWKMAWTVCKRGGRTCLNERRLSRKVRYSQMLNLRWWRYATVRTARNRRGRLFSCGGNTQVGDVNSRAAKTSDHVVLFYVFYL